MRKRDIRIASYALANPLQLLAGGSLTIDPDSGNINGMIRPDMDVLVAPLTAIPSGEGRTFSLAGIRMAIFHTRDGGVYATQADCPHKLGPLADGLTGGGIVVCPLHAWKFDLKTGQAMYGDCGIQTYPARLDADQRIVVTIAAPCAAASATC